ncbi:MAG: glycosyltransferase family 2 protein [Verrucomicrobiales bacterium]|jgi:glycosyltransferase involved in cell wall biosynthesis|nr:glycosyltransferase family 2 protein [Verrucomicrobiales bacterium]
MKFSVLINNYNYAPWLRECVDSVLAQTLPPHEIIVVDDGSTDGSVALLREHYGNNPLVKIIAQKNSGQFVAVDAGIQAADGDVLCLLDADDRYKPDYLASLSACYEKNPAVDLVFCRFKAFGGAMDNPVWLSPPADYDYGYTALLTYFYFRAREACWIGNITSCVSLRAHLARILQLGEIGRAWNYKVQADYGLLLGASLLGGRKYYLARDLVEHRLHDNNDRGNKTNSELSPEKPYKEMVQNRIAFDFYRRKLNISDEIFQHLKKELAIVPAPLPKHVKCYQKLAKKFVWKYGRLVTASAWERCKRLAGLR